MKKFFGFDLDGTLLTDDRNILPSTIEAIKELEKQGHSIAVITGRGWVQYQSIKKMLNDNGINPIYIGNNGSVYKEIGKDLVQLGEVQKNLCKYMLIKSKEYNGLIHMYSGEEMYDSLIGDEKSLEQIRKIGHSGYKQELSSEKTMYKVVHNQKINQITIKHSPEIISKILGDMPVKHVVENIVDVISNVYLECNPKGLTKYSGLLLVCEHLNISKENIYVFGDSNNDIPMMRKDINSVAMGNAIPSVKEGAKYSTDTNNNDGIYKFLKTKNLL